MVITEYILNPLPNAAAPKPMAAVMSNTSAANIAISWDDGNAQFILGIGSSRGWVATMAFGSMVETHVYGTSDLTDGAHLIAGTRVGATLTLRVDGISDAQSNLDPALKLGAVHVALAGQSPPTSKVAEMVVIAGEPSATTLSSLEGYLIARYGI